MKSYTDIEQSRKLVEILPLESADMYWRSLNLNGHISLTSHIKRLEPLLYDFKYYAPCWSLAALLKYLSKIKPQVYTPILFPSEGKWVLQFAEYGHGNVCEVSCDNPTDACVAMIEKLHELNLL